MAVNYTIPPYFIAILFITRLMSTVGLKSSNKQLLLLPPIKLLSSSLNFADKIHTDPSAVKSAAADYGNLVHKYPAAVLHPSSVEDIVNLIKFAYNYNNSNAPPPPFTISARGRSHSVHGQAMAQNGVVVDMMMLRSYNNNNNEKLNNGVRVFSDPVLGYYADVGGEQMWIDVLNETLEFGLAPVSWTDYLYLTVGGTLSNAGISGQSFRYGPQISNVFEMDVVTGKGELVTCSEKKNSELYYGVLGGLGQFGIITRARIGLDPAPKRVKWVRMLYSDFSEFTKDQEKLIGMNGRRESKALDYVEGSLIMNQGPPNNWRSSFFPSTDIPSIMSLVNQHHIIYCLEIAKYYDHSSQHSLDKDMKEKYQKLRFMKGFKYEKDVSYVEFLDRVRSGEEKLQSQGLWDVPHPWLNLFLPKSQISDFNLGVFRDIILKRNITTGPVLVYPMNKNKWDDRTSVAIPDEEIFYTVGFLHSSKFEDWQVYDNQNKDILDYCEKAGIKIKQYFPHYTKKEEWMNHFGSKWKIFNERKAQFDPKMMLAPGQRIFN